MTYQAMWFRQSARKLRLLDFDEKNLPLDRVSSALERYLPDRVRQIDQQGLDADHNATWWELIFVDGLLDIENQEGKTLRVAVGVTSSDRHAHRALSLIRSSGFSQVRRELGIDRQWIVLVKADQPHTQDEWADFLYSWVDRPEEETGCALGSLAL